MTGLSQQDTDKLFNDILQFVSESRQMLKQGAIMELAGLDDHVQTLCEAALQLPPETRDANADKLAHVLAELKELGEEMRQAQAALADEIGGLSGHRKANAAYRSSDAVDNFGKQQDEE